MVFLVYDPVVGSNVAAAGGVAALRWAWVLFVVGMRKWADIRL